MAKEASHRQRVASWARWGLWAVLAAWSLSGCSVDSTPLAPASGKAQEIAVLWWIFLFFGAVIFAAISALLLFAVLHFSKWKNPREPEQVYGNTRLEIAWTAVPAILLVVVLGFTVNTMAATREPAEAAFTVKVIGHQWWWEVQYPDQGVVLASELHIPVGKPIFVEVESVDVQHSWWVPELSGKMDAYPGRTNRTWIQADAPGEYRVHCSEFCGTQHANMAMLVVAHPEEEYNAWLAKEQQPAPEALWPESTGFAASFSRCVGCHAINGSKVAVGKSGPNLTHFGSRRTIAAGTLPNTPENLRRWLHDPNEVKPGTLMGQVVMRGTLSDEQVVQLTEYLLSLK